jgi:hypothetical protein
MATNTTEEPSTNETHPEIMNTMEQMVGVKWTWLVTHAGRILELERVLSTEYGQSREANIQAAIAYHRQHPPHGQCMPQLIFFKDGRLVPIEEADYSCWVEVK